MSNKQRKALTLSGTFVWSSLMMGLSGHIDPASAGDKGKATKQNEPIMLQVAQDESSVEHQIADVLAGQGIKVLYQEKAARGNGDEPGGVAKDELLVILFSTDDGRPVYRVLIDTMLSATEPSRPGKVTERAVTIRLYTATYFSQANRQSALELLGSRNRQVWAGTYWIDTDGELACNWVLNITAAGLPLENVIDALGRMQMNWRQFYPLAKPLLTETEPAGVPAAPPPQSAAQFRA